MNADKKIPTAKSAEFSVARSDKIIISAHALFEGIGIAGLISAAFWYTTAPIAPDGFTGPISTMTIAVSTVISLFLAIPISLYGFRKLIADMFHLHEEITSSVREFINLSEELFYELLQLRCLFSSDEEFTQHLLSGIDNNYFLITDSLVTSVCKKFKQFETVYFVLLWQPKMRLLLSSNNNLEEINSFSFIELLGNRDLSANKSIRKSLIHYIKNSYLAHELTFEKVVQDANNNLPHTGHLRYTIFGIASGVACAEVLLSIGWTVISVLMGVKVIVPISNLSWAIFALSSIFIGFLFGLGMGLSRHKQKRNLLLSVKLKNRNAFLLKTREFLNNIFTERLYRQKNFKSNLQEIYQY